MKNVGFAAALACFALAGGCASARAGTVAVAHAPEVHASTHVAAVHAARGGGPSSNARIARVTAPWERQPNAAETGFINEQRVRADRAAARARERVAEGRAQAEVADEVRRARAYVEGLLSEYAADGMLTPDERNHIRTSVDQMSDLGANARSRAVGGGPRARVGSL